MIKNYNKTIWNPGDIITTEKFNKIIDGTTNSDINIFHIPGIFSIDGDGWTYTTDLTINQLQNLIQKKLCYFITTESDEDYYNRIRINYITGYDGYRQSFFTSSGSPETRLTENNKIEFYFGGLV